MQVDDEQHIGAAVILLDVTKKKVLLGKRKNAYKAGCYGLPGGRLSVGESLEACAKRELLEEVGIVASHIQYLGVIREWQETYDFIHFTYICTGWSGEITLVEPNKCDGWNWFDIHDLPTPLLPAHIQMIRLYKSFSEKSEQNLVDISRASS